jgi:uncharacterized protein YabN with tetrapyrrole methylase and pyrophosphatase domain
MLGSRAVQRSRKPATERRNSIKRDQQGATPVEKSNIDPSPKVGPNDKHGSLTIVGTGIKTTGQLTLETIAWIEQADSVPYVVGDPIAEAVIKRLNPAGAVSMAGYYEEGQSRMYAYNAMVEHILRCVRSGEKTVAAFYGHPGVFAYPSHESIRRARSEGYSAKMLPGISSEDCLFADLGVDPAVGGCQSYEATDFLLNMLNIDSSSQLILWQIGTLGDWTYKTRMYDIRAMPLLVRKLSQFYPLSHSVTVYEAPMFPGSEPMMAQIPLYWLSDFPITAAMTLYVPPVRARIPDPEMLGLFSLSAPYAGSQ